MRNLKDLLRSRLQGPVARLHSLSYRSKLRLICLAVSILPLTITTIFCYHQIVTSLYEREKTNLEYTLQTAADTLSYQTGLYENLLLHIVSSEAVMDTAFGSYNTIYDKYEQFTYSYDVFLNTIYAQHPEVGQITLYTARDDLQHGRQLRSLESLTEEGWLSEDLSEVEAMPRWFIDSDGCPVAAARVPNPYTRYIQSYSEDIVCIRFPSRSFFYFLDNLTADCHLKVYSDSRVIIDYTDPKAAKSLSLGVVGLSRESSCGWTILMEKPRYLALRSGNELLLVMGAVILVCLVLIAMLSRLFSDFSVKRINRLHGAMQIMQGGNFDIRIHDDCSDEIGALTNDFQVMADEIGRLIRENYQNRITLKEAQLKALQAQINPHFLYNCLSLINSRAQLSGEEEISRMSQLMSSFYRTTLNKGRSDTLLRDEVKNVLSYLEIQQLLHDGVFRVVTRIDPVLPELRMPNLILQPLVENAIVHGLLPRGGDRGMLFLTVCRVEGRMHFTVMDNGVGIPPEKLPSLITTESGGYGLKNVSDRLLLTYGEESALRINSIPGESTMITFSIPIPDDAAAAPFGQ
ncbi:MAG: sensor histidine kinase [Oscillospiraceae bacterium]|nr:sensor histidine kinase [Oscillospiraceae bacterium]